MKVSSSGSPSERSSVPTRFRVIRLPLLSALLDSTPLPTRIYKAIVPLSIQYRVNTIDRQVEPERCTDCEPGCKTSLEAG